MYTGMCPYLFPYKTITAASIISYLKASQYKSPEEHAIEHTILLPRDTSRRPRMYKTKKAVNGEAGRRKNNRGQQRKSGQD